MIAAFQGRCPTCGHDTTQDAEALEEYKKWFERRAKLEDGLEVGVGHQMSPTTPPVKTGEG